MPVHTNLNFGKALASMHAMYRYTVFSLWLTFLLTKTRQELFMRYRRICAYMGGKAIGSTVGRFSERNSIFIEQIGSVRKQNIARGPET